MLWDPNKGYATSQERQGNDPGKGRKRTRGVDVRKKEFVMTSKYRPLEWFADRARRKAEAEQALPAAEATSDSGASTISDDTCKALLSM